MKHHAPVIRVHWAGPGSTAPHRAQTLFDRYGGQWHRNYNEQDAWTLGGVNGYTVKWDTEAMAVLNPFCSVPMAFRDDQEMTA